MLTDHWPEMFMNQAWTLMKADRLDWEERLREFLPSGDISLAAFFRVREEHETSAA